MKSIAAGPLRVGEGTGPAGKIKGGRMRNKGWEARGPKAHSKNSDFGLECRKWGFKIWGFKQIQGYLRKKAFFLRFLDFPGAVRALRKKGEKGRKRAKKTDFGRFPGRAARHPLSPHLLHPDLRQPNWYPNDLSEECQTPRGPCEAS